MTVLVCSHDSEPIDGFLRAKWMRECLPQPGYRVRHMHREIPQTPEDAIDFWQIWRGAIAEVHPEKIDWVFGSEGYVHRLAQEVGARPFPVDTERKIVSVSATAIRNDPRRHWNHIPSVVKGYYQRRLVVVGSESSGKTTMARELASKIRCQIIPEYGRDYDAFFRRGQDWFEEDFIAIMDGHKALADTIAARSGPILIEDTDAVQTLVWAEALTGKWSHTLVNKARSVVAGKRYIVLDHTTPWYDDGTRYFEDPAQRAWFTERLCSWLDEFRADWRLIEGSDWIHRYSAANAELDALGRVAVGHDAPAAPA